MKYSSHILLTPLSLRKSSSIALSRLIDGITALNLVTDLMDDMGSPRYNLYEVRCWEDLFTSRSGKTFYVYMVDKRATVILEAIDAVRALVENDETYELRLLRATLRSV